MDAQTDLRAMKNDKFPEGDYVSIGFNNVAEALEFRRYCNEAESWIWQPHLPDKSEAEKYMSPCYVFVTKKNRDRLERWAKAEQARDELDANASCGLADWANELSEIGTCDYTSSVAETPSSLRFKAPQRVDSMMDDVDSTNSMSDNDERGSQTSSNFTVRRPEMTL